MPPPLPSLMLSKSGFDCLHLPFWILALVSALCFPGSLNFYEFISAIFYLTPALFCVDNLPRTPKPPGLLKFNLQESIQPGPASSSQHVVSQWVSCLDVICPDEFCHLRRKAVTESETEPPPISLGAGGLSHIRCTGHLTPKKPCRPCTCEPVYTSRHRAGKSRILRGETKPAKCLTCSRMVDGLGHNYQFDH